MNGPSKSETDVLVASVGHRLIRPDGYVAFRAPRTDLWPVQAHLQRTFVSPASIETQHR